MEINLNLPYMQKNLECLEGNKMFEKVFHRICRIFFEGYKAWGITLTNLYEGARQKNWTCPLMRKKTRLLIINDKTRIQMKSYISIYF